MTKPTTPDRGGIAFEVTVTDCSGGKPPLSFMATACFPNIPGSDPEQPLLLDCFHESPAKAFEGLLEKIKNFPHLNGALEKSASSGENRLPQVIRSS